LYKKQLKMLKYNYVYRLDHIDSGEFVLEVDEGGIEGRKIIF